MINYIQNLPVIVRTSFLLILFKHVHDFRMVWSLKEFVG